ncbi:MAG: hypothetical protein ACRDDG_09035 [Cetobacterium sp.]
MKIMDISENNGLKIKIKKTKENISLNVQFKPNRDVSVQLVPSSGWLEQFYGEYRYNMRII